MEKENCDHANGVRECWENACKKSRNSDKGYTLQNHYKSELESVQNSYIRTLSTKPEFRSRKNTKQLRRA